jgi:hypothetical protein
MPPARGASKPGLAARQWPVSRGAYTVMTRGVRGVGLDALAVGIPRRVEKAVD